MEKFLEVHLIATISNSCEGKKSFVTMTHGWEAVIFIKIACIYIQIGIKKIHFSPFKEDSLNKNLV